jgi:hypothetical protein
MGSLEEEIGDRWNGSAVLGTRWERVLDYVNVIALTFLSARCFKSQRRAQHGDTRARCLPRSQPM